MKRLEPDAFQRPRLMSVSSESVYTLEAGRWVTPYGPLRDDIEFEIEETLGDTVLAIKQRERFQIIH